MSHSTTPNGAMSKLPEGTPNEIFKKMVINNYKQNQRLSSNLSSNGPARYGLKAGDNKKSTMVRFVVCTLGVISMAMSQMSRMVLNQSITLMIDPCMLKQKNDVSSDGSCPWPVNEQIYIMNSTTETPTTTTTQSQNQSDIISDPLLFYPPLEQTETTTQILKSQLDSTTTSPNLNLNDLITPVCESLVDKFKWTIPQQSVVLGGFYYSYFLFMIPGGRLAEIYGAKYLLLLSVGGSALINLATPWMARNSFFLLVFSRIVMGAIQSGVFPAMYALIAKWLTMSEASIYAPLIKMNLRLGMMLGSLLPGILPGWPEVFYFTGAASAIWSALWLFIATSSPQENSWISSVELNHIMKKKRRPQVEKLEMAERNGKTTTVDDKKTNPTRETPWLKILTAPSVIGLIIIKLTYNYSVDFLAIELPSYLTYVHHAPKKTVSLITTSLFLLQVVLIVFVGLLAKIAIQKRPFGMSKTTIRKLFQSIANFGMGISLFLITFNDCNIVYVGVMFQIVSILSMFTAGGETMLPYDLSDEYPATIMAIANSIANVSGITTTFFAGQILRDQGGSIARWNILINLVAGLSIIGGIAFLILVKAEPLDFSSKKKHNSKDDAEQPPIYTARSEEDLNLSPRLAQQLPKEKQPDVEVISVRPSVDDGEEKNLPTKEKGEKETDGGESKKL